MSLLVYKIYEITTYFNTNQVVCSEVFNVVIKSVAAFDGTLIYKNMYQYASIKVCIQYVYMIIIVTLPLDVD
jgi:hypothetical protein